MSVNPAVRTAADELWVSAAADRKQSLQVHNVQSYNADLLTLPHADGLVMKCQQTSAVKSLLIIDDDLLMTTICRLEESGGDSSVEMK